MMIRKRVMRAELDDGSCLEVYLVATIHGTRDVESKIILCRYHPLTQHESEQQIEIRLDTWRDLSRKVMESISELEEVLQAVMQILQRSKRQA